MSTETDKKLEAIAKKYGLPLETVIDMLHDEIREIARDRAEEEEYNRLFSDPTPEQIAGEIQDDIIYMYRRER